MTAVVRILAIGALLVSILSFGGAAQAPAGSTCDQCAVWNAPQQPFHIFANVYYVGPRGLSAILITSDEGHVLLDAALPESVPGIVDNIRALGFRIEDVRLILNSHAHFDHAGGIAALQRLTGASVAARRPSVRVLEEGRSQPDDPQFGVVPAMTPVGRVQIVEDGATLQLGTILLTGYATPGHTPGGTTWAWRSCDRDGGCLNLVYADSLTAVSADGFRFSDSRSYPNAVAHFENSFRTLSAIPCDILLTPHPEASDLWTRIARRDDGVELALVDRGACQRYADAARARLRTRLERERKER